MGVRRAENSRQRSSLDCRRRDGAFRRPSFGLATLALWTFGALAGASPVLGAQLASVSLFGNSGNAASNGVASNTDGSVVVFYSDASNLVPSDTNAARDVFVRDFNAGTTARISVNSSGQQANAASHATGGAPAVSGDGQIVAFYSDATNLVSGDTNGKSDVFVRVRASGVTERVSVASNGDQANDNSVAPSISADGRFVAFQSSASNLVPNDTNSASDIFVRDRMLGTTERVCDSVQGNSFSFSPAISADGNLVAFASAATNLVPGDTNGVLDIFVCDRRTGAIERVSVATNGTQGDGDSILPAINADGSVVGFKSLADNLVSGDRNGVVDVFVRDRTMGTTERISVSNTGGDANDFSFPPNISNDGRFVAFGSFGTNIVPNDANHSSDVFVRDRKIGVTVLADLSPTGDQANNGTPDVPPAISGDGMQIAFATFASNLTPNDTNGLADVVSNINTFFGPGGCPDGMCPSGQGCVQGFCATFTPTAPPTKTPTPTRTGTPTITPTPTPTFRMCTDDSQCQPDEHCRAGFCKKERPCDDSNPSVDRLACFDREACINNQCECGGDCNLDGIVLGNEITKAVLILGGVAPLSGCTSADINGDGQVLGNEITLAVLNLGLGCAQEGQPLLFSHDRGGMVTMTISSTSSAGGDSATVAVDMTGGQGEAATAQIDLLYDPTVLDIGTPSLNCAKDPRLTDQVFLATSPATPPAPAGLKRVRLFVGDISAPVASFADGRLFTCTFQVNAGTSATNTVLAADQLNVGDARGDVFGSQAVNGGVSILVPTPTPAAVQGRRFCAGDCDGDGVVFGNEITVAVRVMAGQAPLSDCPAADADGDGQVFVTDITRAVINVGRGCPQ